MDGMKPIFGIDLGGTKIEGVVLPGKGSTEPITRLRVPTESHLGYSHIVNKIKLLKEKLEHESGFQAHAIGIGTPGTFDPHTGIHKNSNTTCLNGMPFLADLKKATGVEIAMANDANCFALAEATLGSVAQQIPDAQVVFGVIMGTGVGGGLVLNGKVWNGSQGIGGEWGHNFLDASGGPCYCGQSGCVENIISGPALERFYKQISGKSLTLKEIVSIAETRTDPFANQTMERLVHFFGKAISVLINILDPDAIVLGGGVGNIPLLYTKGVEEVAKNIFNNRLDTRFFKPSLGDSAGVFGAAMLVQ
jgi:fructokinase